MIGYCPIDFDETPSPPINPIVKREVVIREPPLLTTECNYLVMFFIVGVFALAAMDTVGK